MKRVYNRIDELKKINDAGEGILSISLAPTGSRQFDELLDEVGFLVDCGLNQLLMLFYEPQVMGVATVAPAEVRAVKIGAKYGTYLEAFYDNMDAIRKAFPDLALIASNVMTDVASYGQKRYLKRCFDVGIDAIDIPVYRAIEDPTGLAKDCLEAEVHYIYSIMGAGFDITDPEMRKKMVTGLKISYGELFVVPGISGNTTAISGKTMIPLIEYVREVFLAEKIDPRVIAIGGINTPEDAYELTRVAGAHGVHFSSAYMKRVQNGVPRAEIASWLKSVKTAMQK